MKNIFFNITLLFFMFANAAHAQQAYEIRAVNNGGSTIGVQLRITSGVPPTTAQNITDIVFGLKWLSSYNVDLMPSVTTSFNIVKSDTRRLKGNYHFQAFSAANTPFLLPSNWTLNTWVEIMAITNTMNSSGTGTFEICEPAFDITTDPNLGIDLVDYTPAINGSAAGVVLPLQLSQFEAGPLQNFIKLSWTTLNENNNSGFEIQRSAKEADRFDSIGWITGKGNSSSTNDYIFIDKNVIPGIEYYYKLKQIDYDNKYKYSEIKKAMLELENNGIRIMPNPAAKMLQVFFDNAAERGTVILKVVDAKGSVMLSRSHNMDTNVSANLNVSVLARGQYILTIEKNNSLIYAKAFQKN